MHNLNNPLNRILILGATGAIGHQLVLSAIQSERISNIVILGRTEPSLHHPKIEFFKVKNDYVSVLEHFEGIDKVFCCLGTTIKQAGSQEAFRKVDYDLVVNAAIIAKQVGVKYFAVVSAMAANKQSSIFYNRVKGEMEEALQKIGFERLNIFRPSLLRGPRKENRFGEKLALFFDSFLGWLLPKKYKSVATKAVATAMLHYSFAADFGTEIIESDRIREMGGF